MSNHSKLRRRRQRQLHQSVEIYEPRLVLSTVTLTDGVLAIALGDTELDIRLLPDEFGTALLVEVDGIIVSWATTSDVNDVTIQGNDLDNQVDLQNIPLGAVEQTTVHLGAGDDTATGSMAIDYIFGESGNDLIFAGGRDDFVDGGAGNDTVGGNSGVDSLIGGLGEDDVLGGNGTDVIDLDANDNTLDLSVGVTDVDLYETDDFALFEISISDRLAQPLTFKFETSDGSATAGEDYESTSGTVTINPSPDASNADLKVPIKVNVFDSEIEEETEEFFFHLVDLPANVFLQQGQAKATIRDFRASIYNRGKTFRINLSEEKRFSSDPNLNSPSPVENIVVGEPVELSGLAVGAEAILWNKVGSSFAVKDYNIQKGKVILHTAAELKKPTLNFHFIAGGKQSVEFRAMRSNKVRTVTANFDIMRPTWNMTAKTTGLSPAVDLRNGMLRFGTDREPGPGSVPPGRQADGISYDYRVNNPSTTTDGESAFLQLVHSQETTDGVVTFDSGMVLDDGNSERHPGQSNNVPAPFYEQPEVVPFAGINMQPSADSPGTEPQGTEFTVRFDAEMYLMYRSSWRGSIWVSLARLDWFWQGKTEKVAGNYVNVIVSPSHSKDPKAVDETSLPTWTSTWKAEGGSANQSQD